MRKLHGMNEIFGNALFARRGTSGTGVRSGPFPSQSGGVHWHYPICWPRAVYENFTLGV